jgi:hypothetical protein
MNAFLQLMMKCRAQYLPRPCSRGQRNHVLSGRFPDLPPETHLPILADSGFIVFPIMGLTVAGTAPDSHRIPFYTLAESQNITILVAKVQTFSYLCNKI